MQERQKKNDEYTDELEKLKTQDANDQAEQKIKLEKEMQILQKCMEDMKAVFRLNEEKLDFNHKVLTERETVNTSTIKSLKRKARHYRDVLKTVKDKYEALTVSKAKENKMLTKDYKKYTREFLLLQKKLERFEKADKQRFNEVWSMNQNEAMALCEKIKDCDRVIHVQQLGIPWSAPTDPIF
jgi:dynein regulatory complex protein 1